MKCRKCKSELVFYGKLLGLISAESPHFESPYLFHTELYACLNCGAKYKKELNLEKLVYKGVISHGTRQITNVVFMHCMSLLKEGKNKEVLEDYQIKKAMKKGSFKLQPSQLPKVELETKVKGNTLTIEAKEKEYKSKD